MQKFELIYILPATFTEKDLPALSQKIQESIKNVEGVIIRSAEAKKRKLSYPIKQNQQGFYGIINFELDPQRFKELQKNLLLNSSVLRFMITRVKPKVKKKKVLRRRPLKEELPREKIAKLEERVPTEKKGEKGKKVSFKELDQKLDELFKDDIVK